MARIVILNGVGSVGKTSTARALQGIARTPFPRAGMDDFLEMLPDRLWGHPDGIVFQPVPGDGPPQVAVRTGAVAARLLRAFRASVAALADEGCDVIVDDVFWEDEAAQYRRLLAGHEVRFVVLRASLPTLEARERARGDRIAGLARWQIGRIGPDAAYDLTVETDAATPEDCARSIARKFDI